MKLSPSSPLARKLINQGRLTADDFRPAVKPVAKPAHTRGKANQAEALYGHRLTAFALAGLISGHKFEQQTLRLADRTEYTPDYAVIRNDGSIEYHEVKGPFAYEDSRVKFKCASTIHPDHRFVWAQRKSDRWHFQVWLAGKQINVDDEIYR